MLWSSLVARLRIAVSWADVTSMSSRSTCLMSSSYSANISYPFMSVHRDHMYLCHVVLSVYGNGTLVYAKCRSVKIFFTLEIFSQSPASNDYQDPCPWFRAYVISISKSPSCSESSSHCYRKKTSQWDSGRTTFVSFRYQQQRRAISVCTKCTI